MAYVEVPGDFTQAELVPKDDINQWLDNIIYNHDH